MALEERLSLFYGFLCMGMHKGLAYELIFPMDVFSHDKGGVQVFVEGLQRSLNSLTVTPIHRRCLGVYVLRIILL